MKTMKGAESIAENFFNTATSCFTMKMTLEIWSSATALFSFANKINIVLRSDLELFGTEPINLSIYQNQILAEKKSVFYPNKIPECLKALAYIRSDVLRSDVHNVH